MGWLHSKEIQWLSWLCFCLMVLCKWGILPTFRATCCYLLHSLHDCSKDRVWTLSQGLKQLHQIPSLIPLFFSYFGPLLSYRTPLPSSVFKIPFLSQLLSHFLKWPSEWFVSSFFHFHCSCFPLRVSVPLHSSWFWFTTIWSLCVYNLTFPDLGHFVTENGGILFRWNLGNATSFPLSASPENKTFVNTYITKSLT
jgi:hypothetical protein